MKKAILATKVGMTQIFNEDGTLTPVTVLQAGPCVVTQIKTVENDGYEAVQLGYVDKKEKIVNKDKSGKKEIVHRHGLTKAEQGHFAKAGVSGKGFQGAIKRHGQHRGPMTHGSKFHRHAGSNGAASDPSKVFKGKKMPGQMGNKKITIQNLEVVRVDAENNLLLVKGSVPGPKKCLVTIKEAVKAN